MYCSSPWGLKFNNVAKLIKLWYFTFSTEKPKWTSEKIQSVKPSIYSSHSWECVATGSPMPNYKWYKNGKQITNR